MKIGGCPATVTGDELFKLTGRRGDWEEKRENDPEARRLTTALVKTQAQSQDDILGMDGTNRSANFERKVSAAIRFKDQESGLILNFARKRRLGIFYLMEEFL